MMYQVLTRQNGQREWRAATPPTSNWNAAQVALGRVRHFFAEGMLVEANTADELAKRVQKYCHLGGDIASIGVAVTTSPATPTNDSAEELDTRRWEMERGLGGDHDEPYVFTPPASVTMQSAWGRLLARVEAERGAPDSTLANEPAR